MGNDGKGDDAERAPLEVVTMRCRSCRKVARVKVDLEHPEAGERRVGDLIMVHARQCSPAIEVVR